ncbi:MAG: GumC family protein [Burkholderiales bacterium]
MNTPVRREVDLEAFTPHKPEQETLDLVRYWRAVNRNKWGIAALVIAVGVLAAIYAHSLPPVYRGTATVMVEGYRAKAVSNEEVQQAWYWGASRDYFLTQYEIIKSREFAEKLVRVMGLTRHPAFDPRQAPPPWYAKWLPQQAPEPEAAQPDDRAIEPGVVASVMGGTSLEPVRNTQIVKLHFDSTDPEIAARVPNTLAMIYIIADLEARAQVGRRATEFLSRQAEALKEKLTESERALQAFRDREKIVETRGGSNAGASRQLEALTLSLIEARQKRADAEALHAQVSAALKGGSAEVLQTLPAVQRHPSIQRSREVAAEAARKFNEASKRYGPDHPRYQSAAAEVTSAQENLRLQVESVIRTISKEFELTRANEAAIERALADAKGAVQAQNRKEFELQSLEREVQANRKIYEEFVQRDRQARAGDMESAVARVIDSATVPTGPYGPNKRNIVGAAVLAALLLGIALAILAERLDNRLKSSHEAEARLDSRSIGVLPKTVSADGIPVERMYQEASPNAFSEAIRTVRSALLLSGIESRKQVVLVTSSIPEEGKSTVASNLALSLCEVKKTLLLEADMRRPKVGKVYGVEAERPGLAGMVSNGLDPEECVVQIPGSRLHVLQAGRAPANPLTLLSSPGFATAMQALIDDYDVIVIDSPPVQLVSEAVMLSQLATSVLFVIKASSTPYPVARHALGRLRRVDAPILGTVLNQIDIEAADKYYGEHSGFGSKYYRKYGYHYAS